VFLLSILVASINRSRKLLLLLLFISMSNNDDEMSDVGSEERVRLEREARLAVLNVPIEERFEVQEPVADVGDNPFQEGHDVQFELPADHPLRAAAAARNRVTSGVAAAGSVVSQATVAAFGRVSRRTLEDLVLDEVIVRKEDRGVSGSKIFVANRAAATLGLDVKFLGSVHLQSKNAAGEQMQKAKNIQDQFVSNLDVMAKLVERIKQYDMLLPLQIPTVYNDVVDVEERRDMGNVDRDIVDLSKHWGKLSTEHCFRWQCDFNGYSIDDDHISNVMLKDLMANSLDPELKKQVDEKYKLLHGYKKGGISYFKLAVNQIFKMSSMAEDSLKSFIKEFGRLGLAKIPHENVCTIATQMDGVAERLADSNVLRSESLTQYITGLTLCSVGAFKAVFLNRLTELTYRDATGDETLSGMSSPEVLEKIHEVSTAGKAIYDHLHARNKWNLPGKHGLHATLLANVIIVVL